MPRQKNTRPTTIYWLQDIRPATIMAGWMQGLPFYVGKTVASVEKRLVGHRYAAARRPYGKVSARIMECEGYIRIVVIEIVPSCEDWRVREKYWIALSRCMFPGILTNISSGGEGTPGYVPSAETRAKVSIVHRGRKHSPDHIEKSRAARKGKKRSAETCARMSAAHLGKTLSPEHIANAAAARVGRKVSAETVAKISAANRGKKRSPEHIERMRHAMRGKKHSPESRAKIGDAFRGKRLSSEHRAKLSVARRATIARNA